MLEEPVETLTAPGAFRDIAASLLRAKGASVRFRATGRSMRPFVRDGDALDVVIGGLGLGYTAVSALEDARVASLVVVEYLEPVIGWHRDGVVPLGERLRRDRRCRFVHADFFALSRDVGRSFDPADPDKAHDAVLLDIDHTPTHWLHEAHARFFGVCHAGEHRRAQALGIGRKGKCVHSRILEQPQSAGQDLFAVEPVLPRQVHVAVLNDAGRCAAKPDEAGR